MQFAAGSPPFAAARRLTTLLLVLLTLPCDRAHAAPPLFVRGGIVVDAIGPVEFEPLDEESRANPARPTFSQEVPLPHGRRLLPFAWQRESSYRLRTAGGEQRLRAPRVPTPLTICTIELEDVRDVAATGTPPDSVVRFAPDSRRLAIGTLQGWLRIVDAYNGRLLHDARIAEGQIKTLAWSPDGQTLYVGEQSPDANLVALDAGSLDAPGTYRRLWSVRLADDLETSILAEGDRFGVYTLPAVHDLHVVDDGRIFAAGLHSWNVDGQPRRRARLYCFDSDGTTRWRFPPDGPLSLGVTHLAVDRGGRRLVFLPSTQHDPDEHRVAPGTLYQLDAYTGEMTGAYAIPPLEPHFRRVESWDSISVSPDATHAAVGLADGRALLFATSAEGFELLKTFELGTPLVVGRTPIAASCSYTRFLGERLYLQTQNTHIPFGSTQAANQAPSAHRGANMLTVADRDGDIVWRYRGPYCLTGNWGGGTLEDGSPRWLLVTCRELPGATEPGQFGFLLFDLARPGGGSDKLVYHYATAGPVIFNADISPDGLLVAVTETPYPTQDGRDLAGTHQVHIVH